MTNEDLAETLREAAAACATVAKDYGDKTGASTVAKDYAEAALMLSQAIQHTGY